MKAKIISALIILSYLIVLLGEFLKKPNWTANLELNNVILIIRIIVLVSAVIVFFLYPKEEKQKQKEEINL